MQTLSLDDARANLDEVLNRVVDGHAPVTIARPNAEPVVIISLSDWRTRDATAHLESTPANASALRESIAELNAGRGVERELLG